MLKTQIICFRGLDGFLHPLTAEMLLAEYFQENAGIWQQLVEDRYAARIVEVLERVGQKARINAVGDIAFEPPAGTLPTG